MQIVFRPHRLRLTGTVTRVPTVAHQGPLRLIERLLLLTTRCLPLLPWCCPPRAPDSPRLGPCPCPHPAPVHPHRRLVCPLCASRPLAPGGCTRLSWGRVGLDRGHAWLVGSGIGDGRRARASGASKDLSTRPRQEQSKLDEIPGTRLEWRDRGGAMADVSTQRCLHAPG